jgi:hypothetical protein
VIACAVPAINSICRPGADQSQKKTADPWSAVPEVGGSFLCLLATANQ